MAETEDTTIIYSFRVDGAKLQLGLEPDDRDRVLEWLSAWLRRGKPNLVTVGSPPTRISRAMIGSLGEPPNHGVALEWALGNRIGIATSTAKTWADDLEQGRPGLYAALQADEVIAVGDS
jgi:hypothetical protein